MALDCIDCAHGYKTVIDDDDDKDDDDEEKEGKIRGCIDIDECTTSKPCSQTEFCTNSEGSYSCGKCDQICHPDHGCSGGSASDCLECREGADWDADRKNCVVVDWTKYDEDLAKQKDEEKQELEEKVAEEAEAQQKEEDEEKQKAEEEAQKMKAEQEARWEKEEAKRMEEMRIRKEKLERELAELSEPTTDALEEEPIIEEDDPFLDGDVEHEDPGAVKDEL